jgi:hypothetical protein
MRADLVRIQRDHVQLERYFSDNYQSGTILDEILKLSGIAAIKEDAN